MKPIYFLLKFLLALGLVLVFSKQVFSQTSNQSDVFPNPTESTTIINEGNQSDVFPNPTESTTIINDPANPQGIEVDRKGFEQLIQTSDPSDFVQSFEEAQSVEFGAQLGLDFYGQTLSIAQISNILEKLYRATGNKAVVTYIVSTEKQLETLTIFPTSTYAQGSQYQNLIASNNNKILIGQTTTGPSFRTTVPEAKRELVQKYLQQFRREVTDQRKINTTSYLSSAQQLYKWIISPIEAQLEANKVNTVVFAMDANLRSTPITALHDGKQFLIEKYAVGLIPSFGLTDTRYVDIKNLSVLAMGASEFKDQNPLPSVPIELSNILGGDWRGQELLNEKFTLENFKSFNLQQRFRVIHLATHGEFQPGKLENSYIQFWNTKLRMDQLRTVAQELGWNSTSTEPVELIVLSACRTALGNEKAELGFAGLAVNAGVKSALASLWYVSDAGTLALMSEFYRQLSILPNKSQALRQAQLAMLKGNIRIEGGQLLSTNRQPIALPSQVAGVGRVNLSHPFFWSAFTLIGNWN